MLDQGNEFGVGEASLLAWGVDAEVAIGKRGLAGQELKQRFELGLGKGGELGDQGRGLKGAFDERWPLAQLIHLAGGGTERVMGP